MKKYGLIGKKLNYSMSKVIHEYLIDYYEINASYDLIEVDQVNKELLQSYNGLNITIPYKQDVIPFLDKSFLDFEACNTILNNNDLLSGYNTDIIGFKYLVDKLAINNIKKVVVLGSGATAKMITNYFKDIEVIIISRNDSYYNYKLLPQLSAELLINTTPIGMGSYASPIDEEYLNNYQGVIDLNYNPINSKLSLDCKKHDIKFIGGLEMLIVQAIKAFEIWNDLIVDETIINRIKQILSLKLHPKIALIGMPMAGKTTLINDYKGIDLDNEIELDNKFSVEELLESNLFRSAETKSLQRLVDENTPLIALGGGAILKDENIELLQDYLIIYLDISLEVLLKRLKNNNRPLLKSEADLIKTYETRLPIYLKYANLVLDDTNIRRLLDENSCN